MVAKAGGCFDRPRQKLTFARLLILGKIPNGCLLGVTRIVHALLTSLRLLLGRLALLSRLALLGIWLLTS